MNERRVLIIMIIIYAAAIAIILANIANANAEEAYILCKPGSCVNVHSRPKKSSPVTAWVECGQVLELDGEEKNGYVHVTGLASEIPDGWVYSGYIVNEQPVIETYTAEIWEGPVLARRCVNGKRKCIMRDGKAVTVYARTHTWAVTDKGFIMCDWLRRNTD